MNIYHEIYANEGIYGCFDAVVGSEFDGRRSDKAELMRLWIAFLNWLIFYVDV